MSTVTKEAVLDALRQVQDPDLHKDIVTLGFVRDIDIDGARVGFEIQLTTPACPAKEALEQAARDAVSGLPGVEEVAIDMTAQTPRLSQSVARLLAAGTTFRYRHTIRAATPRLSRCEPRQKQREIIVSTTPRYT